MSGQLATWPCESEREDRSHSYAAESLRHLRIGVLAAVLAGCGGSGGTTGASGEPGAPQIANGVGTTANGRSCVVGTVPGTPAAILFDYSDVEGDVRGGTVQIIGPLVAFAAVTLNVPSSTVSITGTTAGRIAVGGLCRSSGVGNYKVRLFDAGGRGSNELVFPVVNIVFTAVPNPR
jgi:hypothetical protein